MSEMVQWHELTTTCRTTGCQNNGVSINVNLTVNADGNIWVFCGHCQQRVNDIVVVREWEQPFVEL